jgi:hypothetical protein
MGAPLTPISPTLRHRPPNSLCRSIARNCRFPCQGNEIVGKVWGREGKGNEGGRQNWSPRQSVTRCFFFVFSARDSFWNFWGRKKKAGNSPAGPPSINLCLIDIMKRHQNHLSYLKYLTDTLFHSYCLHTLCARLKFSGSTFPKSSTVGGYFVLVYFFPGDPPFST